MQNHDPFPNYYPGAMLPPALWDQLEHKYPWPIETGRRPTDEPDTAGRFDQPFAFALMQPSEQQAVVRWLLKMRKTKGFNHHDTSYNMKHNFERSPHGFYMTNGQFKGALIAAGFRAKNTEHMNWLFNISSKDVRSEDPRYRR